MQINITISFYTVYCWIITPLDVITSVEVFDLLYRSSAEAH